MLWQSDFKGRFPVDLVSGGDDEAFLQVASDRSTSFFRGMMPAEARAEAGDPPKSLAPPVVDGPFLRPAEGTARGADLGYQGRHRRRALAEPWPARADPRLYALPRTASPHRDELHRCRTGGRAVCGAFPSSRRAASTPESQARRCGRPTCSRTFPSRVNLGAPPEAWSARRTVTERSPSSFPSSAFDNGGTACR